MLTTYRHRVRCAARYRGRCDRLSVQGRAARGTHPGCPRGCTRGSRSWRRPWRSADDSRSDASAEPAPASDALTERELGVLRLVAAGTTNRETARAAVHQRSHGQDASAARLRQVRRSRPRCGGRRGLQARLLKKVVGRAQRSFASFAAVAPTSQSAGRVSKTTMSAAMWSVRVSHGAVFRDVDQLRTASRVGNSIRTRSPVQAPSTTSSHAVEDEAAAEGVHGPGIRQVLHDVGAELDGRTRASA